MSMPGTGGLPARRPDQVSTFQPPTQAPGGAAGVVRAHLVIVTGASGGVFVYSAAGALVASLAGANATDPVNGGAVPPGVTAYPVVGGHTYAIELANLANPFGSTLAALTFSDMTAPPTLPAAFAALSSSAGSGVTIFSGEGTGATQAELSVTDSIISGVAGGEIALQAGLTTIQGNEQVSGTSRASSYNGLALGAFTLTNPGAAAGNPPSGSGTASASTVAGSLLSYFDALASTYNTTQGSMANVVNGLLGWGV